MKIEDLLKLESYDTVYHFNTKTHKLCELYFVDAIVRVNDSKDIEFNDLSKYIMIRCDSLNEADVFDIHEYPINEIYVSEQQFINKVKQFE